MARFSGFNNGFSNGFGKPNDFGSLLLQVGNNGEFEDGDVLHAVNQIQIRYRNAHTIVEQNTVRQANQFHSLSSLLFTFLFKTQQYLHEWDGVQHIRIDTVTGVPEDITGQHNTPLIVEKFLQHPLHNVFGSFSLVKWFDGLTLFQSDLLDDIWQEIENQTIEEEKNHWKWKYSDNELKQSLAIHTNSFSLSEASDFASSSEILGKPKRYKVNWQTLGGITSILQAQILNPTQLVDLRTERQYIKQLIIIDKEV